MELKAIQSGSLREIIKTLNELEIKKENLVTIYNGKDGYVAVYYY